MTVDAPRESGPDVPDSQGNHYVHLLVNLDVAPVCPQGTSLLMHLRESERCEPYHDIRADHVVKLRNHARRARRLINELTQLGYTVTAEPVPT
ncbi:MAG TPA: hypothetical protein VI094_23220 [Propionibacteriaceae bacterium]